MAAIVCDKKNDGGNEENYVFQNSIFLSINTALFTCMQKVAAHLVSSIFTV